MLKKSILLSSALLALLHPAAQAVVLPVAQDAGTVKSKISGKGTTLSVASSTTGVVASTGLIQFDLTKLPSVIAADNVVAARLRLYVGTSVKPGTVALRAVNAAWSEATVLAQPAISAMNITVIPTTELIPKHFITVDVTSTVVDWLSGAATNYGLALIGSTGKVVFGAKEGPGVGYPAELEIVTDFTGDATGTGVGPFSFDAGGRVGLGVAAPGTALDVSGTVRATLFDGAVNGANIQSKTIRNDQLDYNIVGTGNLMDAAVTTPQLADGAVTTPKLADGAVTTAKLGTNSVISGVIKDGAVAAVDLDPAVGVFVRSGSLFSTPATNIGLGGAATNASLQVYGGLRARGGAPGGFGNANNGYAFDGNNGDNDSGLFSTGNGVVQIFSDSVEYFRVHNGGNVGIRTADPQAALHVAGDVRIEGSVLQGTGLGTGQGLSLPIITRHVTSSLIINNSVVAISSNVQLTRDGSVAGLRLLLTIPGVQQNFVATGVTASGSTVTKVGSFSAGAGAGSTATVFNNVDDVVLLTLSFGEILNGTNQTQVVLQRVSNDARWSGTITSTVNQ